MKYKSLDCCLACRGKELELALDLGSSPLADAYKTRGEDAKAMESYPLSAVICKECGHVQLTILVSPEESYNEYLYNSDITTGLSESFRNYAASLELDKKEITVLDIGSNNGAFIEACKERGMDGYGIEPSTELTEFANRNGRKTINGYFNKQTVGRLKNKHGKEKFDVICFNNVLANMENPEEALKLAKELLADNKSRIYIQTGYHPTQFTKGLFDYIYHEHYSYFSIGSMARLAEECGLKIKNTELINIRGGSIRFELCKQTHTCQTVKVNGKYERFTVKEDFDGLDMLLKASKDHLKTKLELYKRAGIKIIGYGASHSTGTLVHHFELEDLVDELVDENTIKHSRYMPGTKLQVQEAEKIYSEYMFNSAVVVLAWQYFDKIANKIRSKGFPGEIIKPILP